MHPGQGRKSTSPPGSGARDADPGHAAALAKRGDPQGGAAGAGDLPPLAADVARYQDALTKLYLDERKLLAEHEHNLDKALTTAVLTIGGGALIFTITMVREGAAIDRVPMLLYGAGAIAGAMVLAVLDVCLNRAAYQRYRSIVDQEYQKDPLRFLDAAGARQDRHWIVPVQPLFGYLMVVLLVVGISLLFTAAVQVGADKAAAATAPKAAGTTP